MAESSYDCIVIGSGPGGYVAAIRAAQLGMKTAVVEKDRVGGRCLNYACIPAKAVLRVADVLTEVREAGEFGIKVAEPEVDYDAVSARREKVISTLTGGVSGLFKKNEIDLIEGEASLAGNGSVTVDGDQIAAKTIVLATGSVKRPIPGTEFGGRVIGTEEAWALAELPKTHGRRRRRRIGRRDRLGVRPPRSRGAACSRRSTACSRPRTPTSPSSPSAGFKKQGIDDPHRHAGQGRRSRATSGVTFTHGEESGEVDWLVIAAGRGPDIEALGLEAAGVKLDDERPDRGRRRDAHERRGRVRDRRPRARPRARPQGVGRGRDRGRGRRRPARPTRSSTSTSRAPRSAPRTSRASASPRRRRASRATTWPSARSSTAPSAPGPCTATAPG